MSDPKVTILEFDVVSDYNFEAPATFFIVNALGQYVFIHTRDRSKAQAYIDAEYGKGKYSVKTAKMAMKSGAGDVTARGHNTRKGFMPHLKKTL